MSRPGTSKGTGQRQPLSRRRITEAALRLIDERGLDALSMRVLGSELGVEAMALYRHVADKGALLDGVVELLLEELRQEMPSTEDWRELIASFGRGFRALAIAHPNAFPLLGRNPTRSWVAAPGAVEGLLTVLHRSGFTGEDSAFAVRAVSRYVIGFSLVGPVAGEPVERPPEAEFPLLAGLLRQLEEPSPRADHDLFEFGLTLLIDGFARRRGG